MATSERSVELRALIRSMLGDPVDSRQWAKDILQAHQKGRSLEFVNRVTGSLHPLGPCPVSDFQVSAAKQALGLPL